MTYEVRIFLGDHDWTLTETPPDADGRVKVTDGIRVLSGLDFGWEGPAGLFLRQPDAPTATFSVNLPDFSELSASISSQCAIEVKADTDGEVIASFYGDVTDLTARTRPNRPGVVLTVIAVGYTVRLAELPPVRPWNPFETAPEGGFSEEQSAQAIWTNSPIAGDPGAVWSSPYRQLGAAMFVANPLEVNPLEWLTALLDQAVNVAVPTAQSRMVVSPVVVLAHWEYYEGGVGGGEFFPPGLAYSSGEPIFTLDTVVASQLFSQAVDLNIPSSAIRRDLSWRTNRNTAPDYVTIAGTPSFEGDPVTYSGSTTAGMYGSGTGTGVTLTGNFHLESEAEDTATFYSIHPLPRWQLDPVTIPVSRLVNAGLYDAADLTPGLLFPDWTLAEGDAARGSCYATVVQINDVPTDQAPGIDGWGATPGVIKGWLTGAHCRIAGGELEFDLTLRQSA